MATFMAEHRATVLVVLILIIFFLWMDVSLYYRVQSLRPVYSGINTQPPVTSQATNHVKEHLFSPFKGLSVKMMMMDQVNNYIATPIAEIFNDFTNFSQVFSFITPNMISFAGLICAIIAAKFVTYDSLALHRVAVLFFQLRTFFDALDGIVARSHLGITKHVSIHNTSGYVVDGLADTLGFTIFLIGCYVYLRRNVPKQRHNNHQYLPLQVLDGSSNGNKSLSSSFVISQYMPPQLVWTTKHVLFVVMCFGFQNAFAGFFWNRYIDSYHDLLESPATSANHAALQNEVLRSSVMWVLMWFWRISNAHALFQMLLLAVFVNRLWDFLTWIQYIGFIEIFTLAFFTEIHLNDVESYLRRVT